MCGIAGIVPLDSYGAVHPDELYAMLGQLRHRGPDGTGVYCAPGVGLAHARLAIVDLSGGRQPLANETGHLQLVCNGEFFNHIELRELLVARGHRFATHSDSEVALHLYEEYGDDFVDHLNGQFALALWDGDRRRLILARDRVGILPLFYTEQQGRLLFASEVKGLLPLLPHAPALNLEALDELLTFWSPLTPNSLFSGVREVSPGEMLIIEGGRVRRRRWWSWRFPRAGEWHREPAPVLAERLEEILWDATRIRLRADVPVGAYLSGGLDSSVVAALARRTVGDGLRTFSIGFDLAAFDERDYQRQMVAQLGSDHSHLQCGNADIGAAFHRTIFHTEAPVLRTAPVPMGLLSGEVQRQGYKVVLTGEGSDEVLGGYDLFKEAKVRRFWAHHPDSQLRPLLLRRLYPYLTLTEVRSPAFLKAFFGQALDTPEVPLFSHLPRFALTAKCKEFFSEDVRQALRGNAEARLERTLPEAFGEWHPFNRGQYLESTTLMGGYLLCSQGDRMLMMHAVEGRFPYLDHRLIDFASRLDPRMKMRVLTEKWLLKRAMEKYLPAAIVKRYKQPYRAPDSNAFFADGAGTAYLEDLLSPESLRRSGLFDPARVTLLVEKARRGRTTSARDNMALIALLSTQAWHRHFIEGFAQRFGSSTPESGGGSARIAGRA